MAKLEIFDGTNWIQLGGGNGTVTSVGITANNGLTVSGSPITSSGTFNLTLGSELQALSAFSQTGLIVRTGSNSYSARTLTSGNGIDISNANGISGNPVISLDVISGNGIDVFNVAGSIKIQQNNEYLANSGWKHNWFTSSVNVFSDRHTIKGIGYLSTDFVYLSRSVQTEKDINGNFADWSNGISFDGDNGYYGISYLNTRTGLQKGFIYCYVSPLKISIGADIDMNSSYKITNLADPTSTNEAATKRYADSLITTQLQNLSNIVTTGIITRTATNTFATRSLAVGSGLSITNSDGVAGNPTIALNTSTLYLNSLAINGDVSLSTYNLTTSGTINATTGTLKGNNLAAYNSGSIVVLNPLAMNNNAITGLPTPVNAQDGTNKQYVDTAVSSLFYWV